jgi:hypothetical protein
MVGEIEQKLGKNERSSFAPPPLLKSNLFAILLPNPSDT